MKTWYVSIKLYKDAQREIMLTVNANTERKARMFALAEATKRYNTNDVTVTHVSRAD